MTGNIGVQEWELTINFNSIAIFYSYSICHSFGLSSLVFTPYCLSFQITSHRPQDYRHYPRGSKALPGTTPPGDTTT
jgi:hypothetical protein